MFITVCKEQAPLQKLCFNNDLNANEQFNLVQRPQ